LMPNILSLPRALCPAGNSPRIHLSRNAPVDVIVIDDIERPSEN
jgi:hypothetical protein